MPTTLDYIGNLMGPAGATGATGADSTVAGPPGTNGTNGTNGSTGATGPGVPNGGTTGQVLEKLSATDQDTAWATVSAGAAAFKAIGFFPSPGVSTAVTGGLTPAKGGIFFALADCTVTQWVQVMTTIAAKTYRLRLFEVNAARTLVVGDFLYSVDVASAGSTANARVDTGTVAWDLTAGKLYALVVMVTDASNPQINWGGTTATGSPGALICCPAGQNGVFTSAVASPVSGSSIVAAQGSPQCEITASAR